MAREKKKDSLANMFSGVLREALDHFNDLTWLGNNSPLAAPYFLGKYLIKQSRLEIEQAEDSEKTQNLLFHAEQVEVRGRALQALFRAGAKDLPYRHEKGDYYKTLIELRYFQSISVDAFPAHLPPEWQYGRAALFNHVNAATLALEDTLVQHLNPSLRLEPAVRPAYIVGRKQVREQCLQALEQKKKLRITGPSGIGKTALVADLAKQLSHRPIFWYTFHKGLNDRLSSLLFSLAFFLREQGAPDMWLQLVADEGKVDEKLVFNLLRHGLQTLEASPPILCFDEIDFLNMEVEAHDQILSFLNSKSLPENLSMLFLGQRVPVEAELDFELSELSLADIRDLLVRESIRLSLDDLTLLQKFTKGNPRLLVLFIALHNSGEPLPDVLKNMPKAPSLEALLYRILCKLDTQEKILLNELCVYRGSAPSDNWSDKQVYLNQLIKLQLVQINEVGAGISILSAYRNSIYDNLPIEYRMELHGLAAHTRLMRAEYTEAAYHCIETQKPELAIRLWYPQQRVEVNQGQAENALRLFDHISHEYLSDEDKGLLELIRSSLYVLMGDYSSAREALSSVDWRQGIFSVRKDHIKGDIEEITGDLDAARLAYEEGLGTVGNLLQRETILFHLDLGWLNRREMNFHSAWHETLLAEYEMEHLRGEILWIQGNLPEAKEYFLKALALAKNFNHARGEAKTANVLASLLAQQGNYDEATRHWETAYQRFKGIGKLSSLPSVRVNQATGYVLAGKLQDAVLLAEEALKLFGDLREPYGIAVAANTLAEAHLALGNLESAEQFVGRVLDSEDEQVIMDGLRIYAEVELARQNYIAAEKRGQQSLKLARQHKNRYIEGYARRVLGRIYKAQKQHVAAREYLEEAIEIFTEVELENEADKASIFLDDLPPLSA